MGWPKRFRLSDGTPVTVRDATAFRRFRQAVESENDVFYNDDGTNPDPAIEFEPEDAPERAPLYGPAYSPIAGPPGEMTVGEPFALKGRPYEGWNDDGTPYDPVADEHEPTMDWQVHPETRVDVGEAQIEPLATPSVVDVGEEDPAELLAYEEKLRSDEALARASGHALGDNPAWRAFPASAGGDFPGAASPYPIEVPGGDIPAAQWGLDPDIGSDAVQNSAIEEELGGAVDLPYSAEGASRRVVEPFSRGFNKSVLMGGSDEGAALLASAAGDDLETALELERGLNEYSAEAHPVPWALGRVAGYGPSALAQAESLAARVALPPLFGMAEGGLSSDSNDLGQAWADTLWGGAFGAGAGATGELLGLAGPALKRRGIALRRASGAPGDVGQLDSIAAREGIDYMEDGLDEAFGRLGLAGWLPQSAAGVAKRIGPREGPGLQSVAGSRLGDAIDTAQAQGVRGDWDRVQTGIDQRAADYTSGVPAPAAPQRAKARALRKIGQTLPQTRVSVDYQVQPPQITGVHPPPPALPRHLQNQKVHYQEAAKLRPGVQRLKRDDIEAEAYDAARGSLADELNLTMQGADPTINEQYVKNRDAFGELAQLEDMARKQAATVKSQTRIRNPFTYSTAIGGSGFGAALSTMAGIGPWPGAAVGGLVGAGAGQKYGQDILGMIGQGAGSTLTGVSRLTPVAAQLSPWNSTLNEPNVTEAAMALIGANRNAFDHYSPRFLEAMAQPEPRAAVGALMVELIQTDPEFRTYFLPKLRGSAVGQR